MFIVSKAGVAPPGLLSRALGKASGGLASPRFGRFAPAQVRASVEASLSHLQTDYLDALLLHEVAADQVGDSLLAELQKLQRDGKVKALGLATSAAHSNAVTAAHPGIFTVVQVAAADAVRAPTADLSIVHSVLGSRLDRATERLASDAALARNFESGTGFRSDDRARLAQLLLSAALTQNATGVTLFSSSKAEHIKRNARLTAADATVAWHVENLLAEA